ncbi:hypothetical protein BRC65_06080 [Halobacteriales archaeon QH_2_65_14]|nr:MAG: hypothetical protein BRC65_06080 [Halobacteriales archaeon QH_2_65_14]
MAITTERYESTRVTATVAVRIPRDSDTDLVTDAQQRLARIDDVREVTVEGLQKLDPRLSATVVTVDVMVESSAPLAELRDSLSEPVLVDRVEHLEPA